MGGGRPVTTPQISVCVPTFNGAAYLQDCLDSILAQTFQDFEVVVIDDCSTDNTVEIAESYVRRDTRFRLLRNPKNLGMRGVPNYNRCLSEAAADWIKFVFQDDTIAPDCVGVLAAARPSSAALIFCDRNFIFEPGTTPALRERLLSHKAMLRDLYGDSNFIPADRFGELVLRKPRANLIGEPTTVLLHRGLAERFGLFNPHIISVSDAEYWARIGTNVGVVRVGLDLATFRVHAQSTTATIQAREFRRDVLDTAVIFHEFAFHPAYASLRQVANRRIWRVNLEGRFWLAACGARWWADRLSGEGTGADSSSTALADWAEIKAVYPRFNRIPTRYWIEARYGAVKRVWAAIAAGASPSQSQSRGADKEDGLINLPYDIGRSGNFRDDLRRFRRFAADLPRRLRHLTGAFLCSVCGRRLRRFQPLSDHFRSSYERYGWPYQDAETLNVNAYSCPFCGASDRDRLCALYVRERLSRQTGQPTSVLDIAPSVALRQLFHQLVAAGGLAYRTADIEREDVDDRIDITDMRSYQDASFDVFLCSHVLEHVPDDCLALRELHRILSPGGWGILMVPILVTLEAIDEDPMVIDVAERWRRFGQDDHVRCYSRAGFVQRIRKAGFHVHALGAEHFGLATLTRCGITNGSVLYVVEKQSVAA
jgi:glycosyltransferase involved in cell wall biosynthesis/SAM-dependent methyltransferase